MKNIGIVAQNSFGILGVNLSYVEWAKQFGNPVAVFPTDSIAEFHRTYPTLGAIILPGGPDVEFKRYSMIKGWWTGEPEPNLEAFDKTVLPSIIGSLPIFGICRGLQTLNVALGGTLTQHLFRHPYSSAPKDMVHRVYYYTSDRSAGSVNSFHHQCIKNLGDSLVIEMTAEDRVIEAISSKALKIFAVQWHPERLGDSYSSANMKTLIGG